MMAKWTLTLANERHDGVMEIQADDARLRAPYSPSPERYRTVPFERCGASGVQLPKVSLGLWQNFGADRSSASHAELIHYAFDKGIVHMDLANCYGPPYGNAESVFGEVLARDLAPYRDELFLSTKAGYDMWPGPYGDGGSRKYLLRSLEQSLTRMRTDYVDVFYHHRPDADTPLEETMGALVSAVHSGKALYVGISNYPTDLAARAADLLAAQGVRLFIHQPRYSLFDRSPEGGLFEELQRRGIGTAVFTPLAQGLLTDRYITGEVPGDSRAARSIHLTSSAITPEYLERIKAIRDIADEVDAPIAQLALAWVLRNPAVTTAIIGASRIGQIDDAIAATRLELTADQRSRLEALGAPVGEAL